MKLRDLPFVQSDENGKLICLWKVLPSSDYAADNVTGREHFRSLLLAANMTGNPLLITRVLSEQVRQANPDCPILIGFMHTLADELVTM